MIEALKVISPTNQLHVHVVIQYAYSY